MISVIGGELYQYDSGRKVQIISKKNYTINEVHFCNEDSESSLVCNTVYDGSIAIASIPNILLQSNKDLIVYAVIVTDDSQRTITRGVFRVHKRKRPDDYVYTETEILNYYKINERLSYLEEHGGSSSGVDFKTDNTLILENGVLSVNTTNQMEKDNTLPITSAGVYATVGNIEVLLKTI